MLTAEPDTTKGLEKNLANRDEDFDVGDEKLSTKQTNIFVKIVKKLMKIITPVNIVLPFAMAKLIDK